MGSDPTRKNIFSVKFSDTVSIYEILSILNKSPSYLLPLLTVIIPPVL